MSQQDHQIFKLVKADMEECGTLLAACIGLVVLLAALIAPFMPSLTQKVPLPLPLPVSMGGEYDLMYIVYVYLLRTMVTPGVCRANSSIIMHPDESSLLALWHKFSVFPARAF